MANPPSALARLSPYGVPATPSIPPGLVTTAFTLDGHRIVKNVGVVRGIVVRSRSIVGNLGAAFQILLGGNISVYSRLCEQARREAQDSMQVAAGTYEMMTVAKSGWPVLGQTAVNSGQVISISYSRSGN